MKLIPYILAFCLMGCGTGDDGSPGANCFDHLGDVNKDGVTDTKDCQDASKPSKAELEEKAETYLSTLIYRQKWSDVLPEVREFILENFTTSEQINNDKRIIFYSLLKTDKYSSITLYEVKATDTEPAYLYVGNIKINDVVKY